MPTRISIILIFLLLSGLSSLAQNNLTIQILNGHTQSPLAHASVFKGESRYYADENGKLVLDNVNQDEIIRVKYIGYSEGFYKVPSKIPESIIIKLNPSDVNLPGVIISDSPLENVFEDDRIHIYDYEFFGNDVLLTLHDYALNRSKLVLYSSEDSIIAENLCVEPPGELFIDCMGKIQVVTKNYIGQVWYEDEALIVSQDSREEWEERLKKCEAELNGSLYFEDLVNNQTRVFYYISEANQTYRILEEIVDEEKLMQRIDLGLVSNRPTRPGDNIATAATPAYLDEFDLIFMEHTFFKPVYSPLFTKDNELFLFDHVNGRLNKYSPPDIPLESVDIHYQKERKWKNQIILDEIDGGFYGIFGREGYLKIRKFNPETGEMGREWNIPKRFPTKIRVRNGVLYFMYKDNIYDPTKRLYKLSLN